MKFWLFQKYFWTFLIFILKIQKKSQFSSLPIPSPPHYKVVKSWYDDDKIIEWRTIWRRKILRQENCFHNSFITFSHHPACALDNEQLRNSLSRGWMTRAQKFLLMWNFSGSMKALLRLLNRLLLLTDYFNVGRGWKKVKKNFLKDFYPFS